MVSVNSATTSISSWNLQPSSLLKFQEGMERQNRESHHEDTKNTKKCMKFMWRIFFAIWRAPGAFDGNTLRLYVETSLVLTFFVLFVPSW